MPLTKKRMLMSAMDEKVYLNVPTTTRSPGGGPRLQHTRQGPFWASIEYLSRKQMESEIASRVTSFQQARIRLRYSDTMWSLVSKAGEVIAGSPEQIFNIISVSPDTGRKQFIDIIGELRE